MADGLRFRDPVCEPLLDVRGVTLQYRTAERIVTATHRVSFQVYPADRFVLLGPSGCGKSSLLKAVAGYLDPVEGAFHLRGRRITQAGAGPDDGVPGVRPVAAVEKRSRDNIMFPLQSHAAAWRGGRRGSGRDYYIQKVGLAAVRRRVSAHAFGWDEAAGGDCAGDGDGAGESC